jgi:uncharacterized protein YkwD
MRTIVALLCAVAVAVAQPLPAQLEPLPPHPLEAALLAATNAVRSGADVAPLAASEILAQAARHHALEMQRLGYLAHTSPDPARAGVAERIALVGGTHSVVGENLAAITPARGDVAGQVLDGWLGSPGHARNLLHPGWTHVGFGVSEGARGRLWIVQVFADDPHALTAITLDPTDRARGDVAIAVAAERSGFVAVVAADAWTPVTPIAAGESATLTLSALPTDRRVHLVLAWGEDPTAALIAQASGWFDPASGTLHPDPPVANPPLARWTAFTPGAPRPVWRLTLRFALPPDLVVFDDGQPVDAEVDGANLSFDVAAEARSALQLLTPLPDGRFAQVHAFDLLWRAGVPTPVVAQR